MNYEQAMDGLRDGQEARRANLPDRRSFIRWVNNRLLRFRSECGWDEWSPSEDDSHAADWQVAQPSRTTDA